MRYKIVYMPSPAVEQDTWYDTQEAAYSHIANMTCGFGTGDLCEMCQAEYEVFSEEELEFIHNEV